MLRQGLWWPMCPVLCSAAPVDHGFETFEILLQNPTALIVLSWAELLSLPSIPSGPHPPSMLDTWLNASPTFLRNSWRSSLSLGQSTRT